MASLIIAQQTNITKLPLFVNTFPRLANTILELLMFFRNRQNLCPGWVKFTGWFGGEGVRWLDLRKRNRVDSR